MPTANNNDMAVLIVIPSPRNKYVNNVKTSIPIANDINLPGQKDPPKPVTNNLVPSMNNHVSGTPKNIKDHFVDLDRFQIIGLLICIQTMACPTTNNNAPYSMFL
jgi:hypothetical protein